MTKKKRGQKPGSMHIDRRADRLLSDQIAEGPDDGLLTTNQLADWFMYSPQAVEIMRFKGTGPRFTRMGPRGIRYRRGDVKNWLLKRRERAA